jgi:hypothetical protein
MQKFNLHKQMFFRKGRLFMPYVYAFFGMVIIYTYLIVRLISPLGAIDKEKISDRLIEILMAEIIILIKVSTWGKKDIIFKGEEKRGINVPEIPDISKD